MMIEDTEIWQFSKFVRHGEKRHINKKKAAPNGRAPHSAGVSPPSALQGAGVPWKSLKPDTALTILMDASAAIRSLYAASSTENWLSNRHGLRATNLDFKSESLAYE